MAPGPFTAAVCGVYIVGFTSQVLLSPTVTARFSVTLFALAQIVLLACWIVLHQRRLHDAGRPTAIVLGIATVYALEIVLLVIVVALMLSATAGASAGAGPDAGILQVFVILYLLTLLAGDQSYGALQIWIVGFIVLMLLPVVIALGFSLWAATRPSKPPVAA